MTQYIDTIIEVQRWWKKKLIIINARRMLVELLWDKIEKGIIRSYYNTKRREEEQKAHRLSQYTKVNSENEFSL